MYTSQYLVLTLLAAGHLVAGHGAITGAVGDQGGAGTAIGIDLSTPRTGTTRQPFEQDTTAFKGDNADTCGQTLENKESGGNDVESGTAAVLAQTGGTLPQISTTGGGSLTMTLHQVNTDGAGPYQCAIDTTGTGTDFSTQLTVLTQVDGQQGNNQNGQASDHTLAVAIPAGTTCTGTVAGQSNVCMVRCNNPAQAGPFGGCVPVQQAAVNGTASATSPSASASGAASKRSMKKRFVHHNWS